MFTEPRNSLMSDLPKERFAINKKPFSKTGMIILDTYMSKHLRESNQLKEITKDMGYYSHI